MIKHGGQLFLEEGGVQLPPGNVLDQVTFFEGLGAEKLFPAGSFPGDDQ